VTTRIVDILVGQYETNVETKREKISWLVDAMMREHIFATMKDTNEIYY
jgi:hypothetical protein